MIFLDDSTSERVDLVQNILGFSKEKKSQEFGLQMNGPEEKMKLTKNRQRALELA